MALSDCIKCWDTPCTCGFHYQNWSKEYRIKQAAAILGVKFLDLKAKIQHQVPDNHPMIDNPDWTT